MSWLNPLDLKLIPTANGESFRSMPEGSTGLPFHPHPGAFGVRRKNHTHEGIDLYAPEGTAVKAVEGGRVVRIAPFTGPQAGLPCWLDTSAVFVEGASGVVVYGEIAPAVADGDEVIPGQVLGHVQRVLINDKGRPLSMLHLELHTAGSRVAPEWLDERPAVLLDPTQHLAHLVIDDVFQQIKLAGIPETLDFDEYHKHRMSHGVVRGANQLTNRHET